MIRKDEIEMEIKREMVRLLLTTTQISLNRIEEVTSCADKLTKFILEKNQS